MPTLMNQGSGEIAEDRAHASGDEGFMTLAVRQDAIAALSANGDYIPFSTDALGNIYVTLAGAALPTTVVTPDVTVVGTFTRINAAAIYAANDCVTDVTPAAITFTNCARAVGTGGLVVSAVLVTSSAPALKGDFDLHLFHTTLVPQADNAPFGPSDAEALTCVGWIKFDTYSTTATNTIYWAKACYVKFTCAAADRNLYGVFAVRNAYIPVANAVWTVRLGIEQN